MHPKRDLLKRLALSEQSRKSEGRSITKSVPELRVPRVDEKLHLQVVGHVKLESVMKMKNNMLLENLSKIIINLIVLFDFFDVPYLAAFCFFHLFKSSLSSRSAGV
jgi:hypothetical protein